MDRADPTLTLLAALWRVVEAAREPLLSDAALTTVAANTTALVREQAWTRRRDAWTSLRAALDALDGAA